MSGDSVSRNGKSPHRISSFITGGIVKFLMLYELPGFILLFTNSLGCVETFMGQFKDYKILTVGLIFLVLVSTFHDSH